MYHLKKQQEPKRKRRQKQNTKIEAFSDYDKVPPVHAESKPSATAVSSAVCIMMMLMVPLDARSVSVG